MYHTNQNRTLRAIKVIQHNVLKWTFARRTELANLYQQYDPDIILLNATGMKENETIKLFNYNTYQRNVKNEDHAGVAIAIKRNIYHQLIDDSMEDLLAIRIETAKGPIILATTYRPFRRKYPPVEDLIKLFKRKEPVYLLADLNARHRTLGHRENNETGEIINKMINKNIISHLGPDFNTRVGQNARSNPDIILRNRYGFLNYAIKEGDLTTSDHIPVIFTLSTTPIVKETCPRKIYSKTNWERVK